MDVGRWFVFTIVCIVTMLDFGIIFSLGAMFVAMVETFQSDRSSTATVQSLLVGISLSFSVLSGALITKFGIRTVAVISSFLVPFGFCISFFVKKIHVLYFTISITSGIGISSIHLISVVVIHEMFPTTLQPLCFAIHGVAVNIAGIVYPFIIGLLLEKYGVNGTFLILGGIFMNSFLIPILLLKSDERYKVADNEQKLLKEAERYDKDCDKSSSKSDERYKVADNEQKLLKEAERDDKDCDESSIKSDERYKVADNEQKLLKEAERDDKDCDESSIKSDERYKVADNEQKLLNEAERVCKDCDESFSKEMEEINDSDANGVFTSESSPDLENNIKLKLSSLFTKQYICLLTASALCIPALNAFLAFTVDIFVWKGFTATQGLFSFVPFNVLSLLSKFIPVISKKVIKRLSCFALPVIFCVCGLFSQLLIYFARSYATMLVGASITGLALGGVFPAMLIAGAKIVRKEEWPFASGLLMTVIGILSSALGPVFGVLRDRTGSYSGAVFIIGFLQIIGLLLYFLGLTFRRNDRKRSRNKLQ